MTFTEANVKTAPKIESTICATISANSTLPASVQRVILVGFMGAGKTTVGRLLAAELGFDFLDLDAHIEARVGARVHELFAQHGEAHFRRLESSALANALARKTTVLALGGGALEQLTNRLLVEQTPGTVVVHLDAPFATLFDRCMLQSFASPETLRPVLASPVEAEARYAARQPFFRRLARHTVATADLTPEQATDTILDQLIPRI
jgi:shikimate kinase